MVNRHATAFLSNTAVLLLGDIDAEWLAHLVRKQEPHVWLGVSTAA